MQLLHQFDTVDTQASMQTTGRRTLDLAIDGDGYFVVSDSKDGKGNLLYTRAGNFYLDNDGNLVNSDGYYVMAVKRMKQLGKFQNLQYLNLSKFQVVRR